MEGLSGKEVILNIGSYEYGKGHDILISAFKKVLSVRADAHLLIVGRTGPETEATNALALRMLPESSVTLLKDLPHQAIPALLKSASLFAFSSRWVPGKLGEGFPIAILEAAVASCPIVTTRTCGADEIIEDNVSGRLVPLENSDALACAILDILEDPAKAIDMGKALKSKVQGNFTWESSYNAYVKLV
jgi:glycosyltransferase involved in cell wall biosynthesis